MTKFIKNLIYFICFSCLFYIGAIFIYGHIIPGALRGNLPKNAGTKIFSTYDYSFFRFSEADTVKKVDLLIIGSSHAYRGYDPRNFEKEGFGKTFNLGSSAQSISNTKYLIEKYVDKFHPKYLIVDVYPSLLENDGVESTINLVSYFNVDLPMVKIAFDVNNVRLYNTIIFKEINIVNNNNFVKNLAKSNKPKESYIKAGYVKNDSIGFFTKKYQKNKINFSESTRLQYEEIVKYAKEKGIKIIFFQAPILKEKYQSITNNNEIDSEFEEIGTYYNFNAEGFLPNDCFFDDSHINSKGVKLYNEYVIKKLKSVGISSNLQLL
ncbi:hypothetical protein ACEN2I_00490 [Flavobacterium sp. W22_SRS_FK3]|uniref:hypothetical protein n=1 Tax=Flavobacterium sp. W22_SRS_FK3 TaxID=3240275 RepID=UPI003F92CD13